MPHYLKHLAELGATDLHPMGRRATMHLLEALEVEAGQNVLEIGCGTGGTLIWAAQRQAALLCGVDMLPEMLGMARRRARRTGVLEHTALALASGTVLPLASGFFDRVYTESVLGFQAAPEAESMLGEIFRVLKPGGLYVANEAIWKPDVSAEQVAEVHTASIADFGLSQASEQAWSLREWLGLMAHVGFRPVSNPLLNELPARQTDAEAMPVPEAVRVSDRLTRLFRLRRFLSPRLAWWSWRYRLRIARYRKAGRLIEGRLFKLAKPVIRYS